MGYDLQLHLPRVPVASCIICAVSSRKGAHNEPCLELGLVDKMCYNCNWSIALMVFVVYQVMRFSSNGFRVECWDLGLWSLSIFSGISPRGTKKQCDRKYIIEDEGE